MSSPINPDPLIEQNRTCSVYNDYKELKGDPLIKEWEDCITDKRPNGKNLNTLKKKQNFLLEGCCKKVLRCNNPNKWLDANWNDNDFGLNCPLPEKRNTPHFGDIKPHHTGEGVM